MVAVHDELTQARVMAVAQDLGARGATGVLEVKGEPSGAVYLDSGRVTFAAASWVPGLADRLRGIRPSPAESSPAESSPAESPDRGYRDADDAAIAALAVRRGDITTDGLHRLIGSIVVDTFLVLMVPLPVNAYVRDIRFTSARTHVTPLFPRLDLDSVRREALRRADRMAKYGLAPTTAVALRDLRRPIAVLTREQWAAASQITGDASARELARRHGAGLADMTECLGSLTRAGLCAPVRVSGRGQLAPADARSPQPERRSGRDQAPTAEVLRQVLDGLRNLS